MTAISPAEIAPPHPLRELWLHFSANRGAVAGLVVIIVVLLLAAFADVIAPHSPYLTDSTVALKPPAERSRSRSAPTRSAATCSRG
jgi:dipeptide transport system permease protein